jgi:hypothetical protein
LTLIALMLALGLGRHGRPVKLKHLAAFRDINDVIANGMAPQVWFEFFA